MGTWSLLPMHKYGETFRIPFVEASLASKSVAAALRACGNHFDTSSNLYCRVCAWRVSEPGGKVTEACEDDCIGVRVSLERALALRRRVKEVPSKARLAPSTGGNSCFIQASPNENGNE